MSLPWAPASRRKHGEIRRSGSGAALVERLVAVQLHERHLARADEEELVGRDGVGLLAPEREEARARHRALLDHHRRDDERHPALDERVDRQAHDRHLEQRAVAHERVRAPARELPRSVPLDEPERRHELDVVFRREVELPRRRRRWRISTLSSSPLPIGTSGAGCSARGA